MYSQRVTALVTPPTMVSRNASGFCGRREAGVRLILSLGDSRFYRRKGRKGEAKMHDFKIWLHSLASA